MGTGRWKHRADGPGKASWSAADVHSLIGTILGDASELSVVWMRRGRHDVALVRQGRNCLFLKRQGDALVSGSSLPLTHEISVLNALHDGSAKHVAALTPRLVGASSDRRALITQGWNTVAMMHEVAHPAHAERIGEWLAELHQTTRVAESLPRVQRPSVLHENVTVDTLAQRTSAFAEMLYLIQHSGLGERITGLCEGWAPSALVHGDLTVANILQSGSESVPSRPVVVDWELAHFGDPHQDLGSLLGSVLLQATSSTQLAEAGKVRLLAAWCERLLAAYSDKRPRVDSATIFGWAAYWLVQQMLICAGPRADLAYYEHILAMAQDFALAAST
jgi:aminoglycoside phosphotransferase (APT) family kinase protein